VSHNGEILAWMKTGKTITHKQAYQQLGCARLAARIYDLRQQGFTIQSERYTTPHGAIVARYSLVRPETE
jgi:hypothetical protein